MVSSWRELIALLLRETESPPAIVIRRDVRNCVRLLRQRMQMRLELVESQPAIDRLRVSNEVKIVACKVDNAAAAFIVDVRASHVPFFRNRPIERSRSAWYFMNRQLGNQLRQIRERLPHTVACDASTDRKEIGSPPIHLRASFAGHLPIAACCSCRRLWIVRSSTIRRKSVNADRSPR